MVSYLSHFARLAKTLHKGSSIMALLSFFENALRSCALCHSPWGLTDCLCSACWKRLEHLKRPHPHTPFERHFIQNISLFDWDSSPLIPQLIYHLKKGGPSIVYRKLAKDLCFLILKLYPQLLFKPFYLVPAPPSPSTPKDHAFCLAQEMGSILHRPVFTGLQRGQLKNQKNLSKQERKLTQVELIQPLPSSCKKFIFIDDVITTGSTARSVLKTLGKPSFFLSCTLASCPPQIPSNRYDKEDPF